MQYIAEKIPSREKITSEKITWGMKKLQNAPEARHRNVEAVPINVAGLTEPSDLQRLVVVVMVGVQPALLAALRTNDRFEYIAAGHRRVQPSRGPPLVNGYR